MGAVSPFHPIVLVIAAAALIIPCARILTRVGMSPWLAILAIVPLFGIVFLWIFAFVRWPRDDVSKEF